MDNATVNLKAGQIQKELERWLQKQPSYLPGERLIFSLRLERILVSRESAAEFKEMKVGSFFTKKRLIECGARAPGATAQRTKSSILNAIGSDSTVWDFIQRYPTNEDIFLIRGVGKTSAAIIIEALKVVR